MSSLVNEHSLHQSQSWSFDETNKLNNNNEASPEGDDNQLNSTNTATSVRKRTRATADQLAVLEETFAVNVSPNSKLRKQLAEQLNMTERSIQIWFQNRRAKVKHIQKKAQMQIHQASIRAQLYQYQQQHQHLLQPYQQQQHYHNHHLHLARSQSVDSLHHHLHPYSPQNDLNQPHFNNNPSTPLSYSATPPPMSFVSQHPLSISPSDTLRLASKSVPPQSYHPLGTPGPTTAGAFSLNSLEYTGYSNTPPHAVVQQRSKSTIPTLVSVPDAGPTAMLATATSNYYPSPSPNISYSQTSSSDAPVIGTIDPSNLIINHLETNKETEEASVKHATTEQDEEEQSALMLLQSSPKEINEEEKQQNHLEEDESNEEPKDLYLSTTTLTIGSWHRLKMQETDLVCVYRPDTRIFAWHIVDGGYHFKMEVPQKAVSSIEFVYEDHESSLADVHFDISEPPLFYMESTTSSVNGQERKNHNRKKSSASVAEEQIESTTMTPIWVQCSDFTEGKQASRLFRHTLKGVAHLMQQELMTLISNHEETRRLVHFIDARMMMASHPMMPMYHQPTMMEPYLPIQQQPHHIRLYQQYHPHLDPNTMDHHLHLFNEPAATESLNMN